jgi:hypothetical protein
MKNEIGNFETKKSLKGKKFKALRVAKGLSVESIPRMRKAIQDSIKDIPEAILTETETSFELNNGQFWLKPKTKKETIGILDCIGSFITFENCRIEWKDFKPLGFSCFETESFTYSIHEELKNEK